MHRRITPIIAAICAVGAFSACGSDDKQADVPSTTTAPNGTKETTTTAGDSAKNTVSVDGFSFVPADITIASGDSVTFTNPDGVQHTVTPDVAGSFRAADTAVFSKPGAVYKVTFAKSGTFKYHCEIHGSGMSGTVTVTA